MAGATETAQQKLDRHPQLQFRLDMKMAQYVKHILEVDLFHTAIKRASCNVEGPDQVPMPKDTESCNLQGNVQVRFQVPAIALN